MSLQELIHEEPVELLMVSQQRTNLARLPPLVIMFFKAVDSPYTKKSSSCSSKILCQMGSVKSPE